MTNYSYYDIILLKIPLAFCSAQEAITFIDQIERIQPVMPNDRLLTKVNTSTPRNPTVSFHRENYHDIQWESLLIIADSHCPCYFSFLA